jgi:hypothetical protein
MTEGEGSAGPQVQLERELSEVRGGGHLLDSGAAREHIADQLQSLGTVRGLWIVEAQSFELLVAEGRGFVVHGRCTTSAGFR